MKAVQAHLATKKDKEFVFDENKDALRIRITDFMKSKGLKVRSHDFRTTTGTELIKSVGVLITSKVLGHKKLDTTVGYGKLTDYDIVKELKSGDSSLKKHGRDKKLEDELTKIKRIRYK